MFRKGLRLPLRIYVVLYIKHLAVAIFCAALIYSIFGQVMSFYPVNGIFSFLLYGGSMVIVYAVLLMLFVVPDRTGGIRDFVRKDGSNGKIKRFVSRVLIYEEKSQFFERTDKIALFLLVVCLGFRDIYPSIREGCICVSRFLIFAIPVMLLIRDLLCKRL